MAQASKYRDYFPELVRWMCRNGLTGEEIAAELGVNRITLYKWRARYPEFAKAFDDSKDLADARVVDSLYRQAIGGSATACIFWLKNRRRNEWRDTWHHEVTGKDGGPIEVSDADRKQAEDILTAQILEEAERIARDAS